MTSKIARLALSAAAASLLALPAFAQSAEWTVDSNHSSARIAAKPQFGGDGSIALVTAAARGILHVGSSNPATSTFEFDLYPVNAGPQDAADDPAEAWHLTFRSEKAELTADGKLKLSGALTVSHVIREARLEGNEAYSGPVETGRVVFQTTREESLILPIPSEANNGRGQWVEVSTSLNLSGEDFPELMGGAISAGQPGKAQDRNCESSASSGEDYSGVLCTGSAVEAYSANRTAASISEDYAGGEPISGQPANLVTVALNLRLAPQGEQVSAKTGR